MKTFLHISFCFACCAVLAKSCTVGLEKEALRQCIVALEKCEKYADAGACASEFLKVCEGVE